MCSAAVSMFLAEPSEPELIAAVETIGGLLLERIYYESLVVEGQNLENIKEVEDIAPQSYNASKGGGSSVLSLVL